MCRGRYASVLAQSSAESSVRVIDRVVLEVRVALV